MQISGNKLSRGDYDVPIKVEVWDWEKSGKHRYVAETYLYLGEILRENKREFEFWSVKKKKKGGSLILNDFSVDIKFTLLDYIQNGLHINSQVAIDFTGSNGDPRDQKSLHYISS